METELRRAWLGGPPSKTVFTPSQLGSKPAQLGLALANTTTLAFLSTCVSRGHLGPNATNKRSKKEKDGNFSCFKRLQLMWSETNLVAIAAKSGTKMGRKRRCKRRRMIITTYASYLA
jgi:hypothetical protein